MAITSLYKACALMTSFFSFLGGIMLVLAATYSDTGYALFKSNLFHIVNGNHMDKFQFDIYGMIIPGAVSAVFGLLIIVLILLISDGSLYFSEIEASIHDKKPQYRSGNGLLFTLMGCGCFTLLVGIYLIFHSLMLSSTLHTTKFVSFVEKFIFVDESKFSGVFGEDLNVKESLNALNRVTFLAAGIYIISIFFYAAALILSGVFALMFGLSVKGQKDVFLHQEKQAPIPAGIIQQPLPGPTIVQQPINPPPPAPSNPDPIVVPAPSNDPINSSHSSNIQNSIHSSINNSQSQQPPMGQQPRPGQAPRGRPVATPGGARPGQGPRPTNSRPAANTSARPGPGNVAPRPGNAPARVPNAVNVSAAPRGGAPARGPAGGPQRPRGGPPRPRA